MAKNGSSTGRTPLERMRWVQAFGTTGRKSSVSRQNEVK